MKRYVVGIGCGAHTVHKCIGSGCDPHPIELALVAKIYKYIQSTHFFLSYSASETKRILSTNL
jgi:hypothetical protein